MPEPQGTCGVQVTLDGRPAPLTREEWQSLVVLRACMEQVALRQRRVLVGLRVDGVAVGLEAAAKQTPPAGPSAGDAPPLPKSRTLAAQSVSVRLQPLARRLEELALLATINDWPHIERLWLDLLPDLRGTVMDLGVLEDVYGADLRHVRLQDRTLAMHLEALTGILKELSACLAAEKPLDLSDVLERRLAPWIKELEAFLLQLK